MSRPITPECQKRKRRPQAQWTPQAKDPSSPSPKPFFTVHANPPHSRNHRNTWGAASPKPITLILAIVLFAGGISLFIFRVQQTTKPKVSYNTFTMMCTNPDCPNPNPDRLFRMKFRMDNVFPQATCPFCKLKAAYRAVRCRNCETVFALVSDGKTNPTFNLRCPQCGSDDIDKDSSTIPLEEKPGE